MSTELYQELYQEVMTSIRPKTFPFGVKFYDTLDERPPKVMRTSHPMNVCQVTALYTVAVPRSLAETLNMRQVRAVPDEAIALTVDVSPVWETKLAAIRCHATQLSSSPMMSASEERQRLFFGREHFVRAAACPSGVDFLPGILNQPADSFVGPGRRGPAQGLEAR